MIRAYAENKDVVIVQITGIDWRALAETKARFKAEIAAADRYWDGKRQAWVITRAGKYVHLWFIDHALRQIMVQGELPV